MPEPGGSAAGRARIVNLCTGDGGRAKGRERSPTDILPFVWAVLSLLDFVLSIVCVLQDGGRCPHILVLIVVRPPPPPGRLGHICK